MPDTFAIFVPEQRVRHSFKLSAMSFCDDPETLGELADRVGKLKAAQAELEAYIGRMRELFVASGKRDAAGKLFQVTLGTDSMQSRVDRKALEKDMGEPWLAKYLKWSPRRGSFECAAKSAAPARKRAA